MTINEVDVLRWLHVLAMVYWLGGEWGVFQTSYHVVDHRLPLAERQRHMETSYRIDIPARTGIILLLPLGLHMGHIYGLQPLGGYYLTAMWVLVAAWLALAWSAFFARGTDRGLALTRIDDYLRYGLIPLLILVAICSLLDLGPLTVGPGTYWYPSKMLIYALMLCIGLVLRFVMRSWALKFRILAQGPNAEVEAKLEREISLARTLAYIYWIGIITTCFLGATKPF